MSIIVIESGGSKSTWWYENNNTAFHFETVGLHPYELTDVKQSTLIKDLQNHSLPNDPTLYFYGAGCESQAGKKNILELFQSLGLPSPSIATDLLGACVATWGKKKGVTAILGTGAIAAHYDGTKITKTASGLGYILGDEGSGFDLGKRLLVRFFNDKLPEAITTKIIHHFTTKDAIIQQVYAPSGRKKVADLCTIIHQYKDVPVIKKLIQESFEDFVLTALKPLGEVTDIKTVGSIGYYFHDELKTTLKHHGITCANAFPSAHKELFMFHRQEK